jgi:hypothetical protein
MLVVVGVVVVLACEPSSAIGFCYNRFKRNCPSDRSAPKRGWVFDQISGGVAGKPTSA